MFQITKLSDRRPYSLQLPSGTPSNPYFFAETIIVSNLSNPNGIQGIARGIACEESPTAPGIVQRAFGVGPIVGFITRNGLVGGPTLADSVMPNRTALPFTDGDVASFEYAEEFVAENDLTAGSADLYDHIWTTGAGALAANTPLNTPLSFSGGKVCKAVSGQLSEFILAGTSGSSSINPLDTPDIPGALRVRARKSNAWIKP